MTFSRKDKERKRQKKRPQHQENWLPCRTRSIMYRQMEAKSERAIAESGR